MHWLALRIRTFFFCAFFATPTVFVGTQLAGRTGALVALVVTVLILVLSGGQLERLLCRIFSVSSRESFPEWDGARKTLSRIELPEKWESETELMERISIYEDPLPGASVGRALGGQGRIFLSQGFIALASEEQVREVLRVALFRVREPGLTLKTFCACLSGLIYFVAQGSREKNPIRSPGRSFLYLLLMPIAELFLLISPKRKSKYVANAPQSIAGVSLSAGDSSLNRGFDTLSLFQI
jgi:hypothetical protein